MAEDGASIGHPGRKRNVKAKARLAGEGGIGVQRTSVWDPDQVAALRDAEEARRQAEEANKRLIIDAINEAGAERQRQAKQQRSRQITSGRSANKIDADDRLVEEMERMRRTGKVSSRWKAADLLACEAKGRARDVKLASKRRRLHDKHGAKYPGDW